MIVLHAAAFDGQLVLWGEVPNDRPAASARRGVGKKKTAPRSRPESSPFDAGASGLREALEAAVPGVSAGAKDFEPWVAWLPTAGAEAIPVAPASPWENGYIEAFHSRLRDEFLEREEFETVAEAKAKGAWWRREYNTIRPHSSLGYKTPKKFSGECDRGRHGQPPKNKKNYRSTN